MLIDNTQAITPYSASPINYIKQKLSGLGLTEPGSTQQMLFVGIGIAALLYFLSKRQRR